MTGTLASDMASASIFAAGMLTGRTAIITGDGTEIGFAIARELGRLGACVIIATRTLAVLEAAAACLCREGIEARCRQLNIRNDADVAAFFAYVKEQGWTS